MKQKMNRRESLIFTLFLLVICIYFLGIGLLTLFTMIGLKDITSGILAAQISILILGLAFFKFKFQELKEIVNLKLNLKDIMIIMGAVLFILFMNSGISIIINLLGIDQGGAMQDYKENVTGAMAKNSIFTLVILPIIVAPIVEELAFRAGFKKMLMDNSDFSAFGYVVISSLIFGLLHYQPSISAISPAIITASIGIINAILYLKTKNILIPIAVHTLYNSLVMYIVFTGL